MHPFIAKRLFSNSGCGDRRAVREVLSRAFRYA
jgi:hypothetical protein